MTGQQNRRIGTIQGAIAALLLLVGAGLAMTVAGPAVQAASADVVYNQPFRAIHEMKSGPPIPFLPTGQPQPKIVIPHSFYDFGKIGPKDVVQHQFLVRNEGKAPLTISRAFTTCGCTTAYFTARIIPPGKAALVSLVFDAGFHDTAGQTVKRGIIIENNDPMLFKMEIWTKAVVAKN